MPVIYDVLRIPAVYRLSQMILGAGCEQAIRSRIRSILDQLPPGQRVLDVGCGPVSYLWQVGLDPVGLDLEPAYTKAFAKGGREVVTASADNIPFEDGSFDSVWTLGLLHHLPDPVARMAVGEILRVCRPGGYTLSSSTPSSPSPRGGARSPMLCAASTAAGTCVPRPSLSRSCPPPRSWCSSGARTPTPAWRGYSVRCGRGPRAATHRLEE